ncbi:MAG: hypothetical protein ACOWWR_09100 [Eubacteriales bacterium]
MNSLENTVSIKNYKVKVGGCIMSKEFKPVLTRKELIERYNMSEEDQVYLLDIFEDIEKAVYRHLSFHL